MELNSFIKIIGHIPGEYLRLNEVWQVTSINTVDVYLSGPFGGTFVPLKKLRAYASSWKAL